MCFRANLLNSTRVDEGRKGVSLLAITMKGTDRNGKGEGEPAVYVTPDLSYD